MLGSGLAVTYFTPDVTTVGASGAIFGLFGAMLAIGLRMGKRGRNLIMQTLPILALNLFITFRLPFISIPAHIGGLLSGLVCGLIVFFVLPLPSAEEPVYVFAGGPDDREIDEDARYAQPARVLDRGYIPDYERSAASKHSGAYEPPDAATGFPAADRGNDREHGSSEDPIP